MSSHKKRHKRETFNEENSIPNNYDFSNIINLIKGIDINQLTEYVSTMNNTNQEENDEIDEGTARRNEILSSIKTLIDSDKTELLQVILQLYAASKNIKK
jgi:hypothetical protein